MAGLRESCGDRGRDASIFSKSGSGVCMMSTSWKDKQHPAFISFISSFLSANSYRLNFLPIAPDFIFNNGGLSVAFIFDTIWDCDNGSAIFSSRAVISDQDMVIRYGVELGSPTFVPVRDPEMGFEKIVKIAHSRGVCKQQGAISMMKNERERAVQGMDLFLSVVTSIPGIDNHDANALAQAIGSIEAISRASKNFILENTDLSTDKAERIMRFFRDSEYYLSPRIA